ncbi:tyrosine-type recombinase/integrase [Burkholderia gladioli]|uniref:tyrosine-type recombinase/integrase n=1 Tax=Burkholderia gladioli TaxID=28095 RepID=UPI00164157A5|nr:site-specific integrase [Burkholderia gladioli]
MASFVQRGDKWLARISVKGYPKQNKTFPSHAEAKAWAAEVEAAMYGRSFVDVSRAKDILFGKLVERYRDVEIPKRNYDNKSEYYRLGKIARSWIGQFSVYNLTPAVVAQYRDERINEVGPATVARELANIQGIINHACREWGLQVENPCYKVKKPKLPPGRNRLLSDEQLSILLHELRPGSHAMRSPYLRPLVQVALETAMRRGELLKLTWDRVDLERRTAYLPITKNGKSRTVPLSSKAVEILSFVPRTKDKRVFPISSMVVDSAWWRLCKRAGIEDFNFHDLRHMATTRLAKKLPNVIELSAVTGHSNPKMLSRYYHTTPEELALKIG